MSEIMGGRSVDDSKENKLAQELKAIVDSQAQPTIKSEIPESITRMDLSPREIAQGETEIVFQRHGRYERDENASDSGSLTPESQQAEFDAARVFFQRQIESVPATERSKIQLLVVASDTRYMGKEETGMRSTETANIVISAAREVLQQYGLSEDQILNDTTNIKGDGEARPTPVLREPNAFNESPEYINFLKEKYELPGQDSQFWAAFEGDWEKETREAMGAEGPDQMADRLQSSLNILARYSKFFHQQHPDSRLIIWAATHYDTISPFVKREVVGADKDTFLGVDYGAGIAIKLNQAGQADTIINGKDYSVGIGKSR